jgi:hypothetical protein
MKKRLIWKILLLFSIAVFFTGALNAGPISAQKKTPLVGTATYPPVEYNEWLKVQLNPSLKDADKVACTIDTFFNLKYKSWMKLALLDFGFLFDRKSANGAEDYAYERGLYYSWLTIWRECNTPPNSIDSYKYEPKYFQLSVDKNKARVRVNPLTLIVHSNSKGITDNGPFTEHVFTMIHKNDLWLIRSVVSTDEMRARYPHGTDFDEALKKERKVFKEWQDKQDDEEAELMKDPKSQRLLLHGRVYQII